MKNKIYIAGKISDMPEAEYKSRFSLAADHMQSIGWQAVNPCELNHCENSTWSQFMLADLAALFECEAIYMLNNWRSSKGARIEHAVAVEMGKKIFYQPY